MRLAALPFLREDLEEGVPRHQPGERVGADQLAEAPLEVEHAGGGAKPREQFALQDRFAEEVVGADVEGLDQVPRFHFRRKEEDVDVVRQRQGPHAAAEFQAVDVGHLPVGDDVVGALVFDGRKGLAAVGGAIDAVTRLLQPRRQQVQHRRIVVDQKHSGEELAHGSLERGLFQRFY